MNSSIITFDIVKDRVLSLLKEDTNDEKEFLTCPENFNDAPKYRQWSCLFPSQLVNIETFEILIKEKLIINFFWAVSKNKIDMFPKILLKLGIMFSYVFRN